MKQGPYDRDYEDYSITNEIIISTKDNREIYRVTADFFHNNLLKNKNALDFLIGTRGRTLESIKHFNIGFIEKGEELFELVKERFEMEDVINSGIFNWEGDLLFSEGNYTTPILFNGNVYNIKSKDYNPMKEERKDQWIPFKSSGNNYTLTMNADCVMDENEIYIVEGENDVMALWENGKKNVIGVMGQLKNNQVKWLRDLQVNKNFVLAFDNDTAGKKYADKLVEVFNKRENKIFKLEYEGTDPDECFTHGDKKSKKILINTTDYLSDLKNETKILRERERKKEINEIEKQVKPILEEINKVYRKVEVSGKIAYIKSKDRLGAWANFGTIRRKYSKYKNYVDKWDEDVRCYDGLTIRYEDIDCDNENNLNLFTGWGTTPIKGAGKTDLIHKHIYDVICNGDKYSYETMLNWISNMLQHPHEISRVTPVLVGPESAGKGQFTDFLISIINPSYCATIRNSSTYTSKFNSILEGKLFIFIDEASFGGSFKEAAILKGYIGNKTITIERKNYEPYVAPFFGHFLFSSNDTNAVKITEGNTRYWILKINGEWAYAEKKRTQEEIKKYFDDYNSEIENGGREAFFYEMLNRDVSKYNRFSVPVTELGKSMVRESLNMFDSWFYGSIYDKFERPKGWLGCTHMTCDKLISIEAFESYMKYVEFSNKYDRFTIHTFNERMKEKLEFETPFKRMKDSHNESRQGWVIDRNSLKRIRDKYETFQKDV